MRTQQNWDPVDEEIARLLEENPDLVGELDEFEREYGGGKAELISDEDVRKQLEARGLKLSPRHSAQDTSPTPP